MSVARCVSIDSVIGWGFAWRREDFDYSSRFTAVCIEDLLWAFSAHSIV